MYKILFKLPTCIVLILLSSNVYSQCWLDISTDNDVTLAIKIDGTLWAWGDNSFGALGDGTTINKLTPTQIGTSTNWHKINTNTHASYAIKTDGTLWVWGDNKFGRHGGGTVGIIRLIPTQIGTDNDWVDIKGGQFHSIALKSNGTIWTCGGNSMGQLGNGTTIVNSIRTQMDLATDWAKFCIGLNSCFAIKTDGTLWAWGSNSSGQLGDGTAIDKYFATQVGTDNNWAEVSAGGLHVIAIKTDGTLWGWGSSNFGQLGDGTTNQKLFPSQIGLGTNWAKINANWLSNLAVKANGSLWAWGYNASGQLGDGTVVNKYIPTAIGFSTNWDKVCVGYDNKSYAIKTTAALWGWGENSDGFLGDGTTTDQLSPVPISCPVTVDINENEITSTSIFPNPTNGSFFIKNSKNVIVKLEVLDFQGKVVDTIYSNKQDAEIDISSYANGIYLLKLNFENSFETIKIVKQ